ncbi:alpha/beta hydrolase [Actinoplanes sp. NBRC 103695]|uniref:alpha/beta fold hydrolase n=1 Tax=Actinoplanes sp. NBRC 103695 TaxID=3032202 RepID=UPI0024A05F2D|nr:alpha/beta hydrolase [Actinoplanes sp. NBRC 103695]GLY97225.1 alpha/beta hydrolase [Actinoplanes sp. NBRC 103695]
MTGRPGIVLHYDDGGPGDRGPAAADTPMVLVHGWLGSSDAWSAQLPLLRSRRRAVAVDLRGHGGSDTPGHGYGTADLAADLAETVEHLGIAPVVVVGHSMGASAATVLAVRRPDLVRALVLIDPDYAGDPAGRALLQSIADRPDDDAVHVGVIELFARRIDAATTSTQLRDRHRREVMAVAPAVVTASLRANIDDPSSIRFRPAAEPVLARRTQPVLSFHRDGERARLEETLATHPASRAVLVPGAGHWIHQEQVDLVDAETERWLASLD